MSRGGWTAGCRPTATGILILLCTLTGSALQAQSLEQCLQFKSFAESEKEPRPEQLLNQSFKPMDRLEQLGFHRGPVWLRCSFKDLDPFPASGRHRLLLANGFIQYVDVYLYKIQGNAAERIARFRAGSSVHSDLHRWQRQPAFDLPELNRDQVILIRTQTGSRIRLPLELITEKEYESRKLRDQMFFLTFYGILAVLFVSNLLGFAGLRDRRYLELNGFLLPFILYHTYLDQLWPAGFGGNTVIFQMLASCGPLALVFFGIFLERFIELPQGATRLRLLIRILVVSGAAVAFLQLFSFAWGIRALILCLPIWLILLVMVMALAYGKARREVRFLAWAIFISLPLSSLVTMAELFLQTDTLLFFPMTRLLILPGALLITVSVTMNLSRDAKERQEALEEAVKERTRQLMAESLRSEEAGKIKDNVLRIVSHDIRSPLAALKTNLPLLQKPGLPEEVRGELVREMESTVDELLHLSNWLLESSRAGSGKPGLEPRWVPVHQVLQDIASRFSSGAEQTLSIQVSAPEDWEFLIDPPLFASMVSNLISNALPHLPGEGLIDLVANLEGEFVLRIIDNGSGVPEELQKSLFDPTQVGRKTLAADASRGRGLGLILSREIALLHGGELELEHSVPGQTVFRFRMPQNRVYIPGHESSRGQSIVLLVDDDPAFRQMVRTLFFQADPELATVEASNTRQALRILRELRPRLILTDVWMPGEDGFHLIQSLAGDERFASIPVWAISADPTTRKNALAYENVTAFIEKPIRPERLKKKFSDFARESRR